MDRRRHGSLRHALLVLTAVLLLAACTGSTRHQGTSPGATTEPGVTTTAPAVTTSPANVHFAPAPGIQVPAGYRAEIYATGLDRPTALAFGPQQRLYATQEGGTVVAVPPRSRQPRVVAAGFSTPLGLAWSGQTLYVSSQGRLDRLELVGGRLRNPTPAVTGLPYGLHQQDNVVVLDGRLFFGSGSTCNACAEPDARSAAILSVRPDGSDLRIVATGLRNPFGLAVEPATGRLFASVNARDDLGDAEPADSVVLVRKGRDFGWPDCWPSAARKRLEGSCAGVAAPVAYVEPHSSADGMAFWRGRLYVALWGQYYSSNHGRYVARVAVATGRVTRFARGFEHPLALAVDPQAALLVADYGRGIVYRIVKRPA